MIEAVFDRGADRSAMASGAYQYDTGQRLRMHGLPSPEELEEAFASGTMVTMQVHFGLKGDSQTQARLALWEEATRCWVTMIPDEYLQTAQNVHAYVYVSCGADESGNGWAKTMYDLVLRPIARPAPNNVATGEQWEAWAVKAAEMDLTLAALQSASENAASAGDGAALAAQQTDQAAKSAQSAAESANAQIQRLNGVQAQWSGMKISVSALSAGSAAKAAISGGKLVLSIPAGANGAKGDTGDTGPADIALSMAGGVLEITPKG